MSKAKKLTAYQRKSAETKKKILAKGRELAKKQGDVRLVTKAMVARALKIAPGTIGHHFFTVGEFRKALVAR